MNVLGARYRLVVDPPKAGKTKAACWCESRRVAPGWMPRRLAHWWARWRRVSKVHRLGVQAHTRSSGVTSGAMPPRWVGFRDRAGRRYIPLADGQEWQRMAAHLEAVGW